MAEFQWQAPPSLENGTIADLMLRGPDALANGVRAAAQARAQATANSGQAWGNAVAGAGGAIAQGIQQATDPQRKLEESKLKDAQDYQSAKAKYDTLMAGGLQLGESGPKESFLTQDGLYDIPKITESLTKGGLAHFAPDFTKSAESINDSLLKANAAQQKSDDAHTVLMGDAAYGVQQLVKAGVPIDQAMDTVVQPILAHKRIKPEEYAQLKQHILGLPPEQQEAVLGQMMDASANLQQDKTIAKDAIETDAYGRTKASNIIPDKPKTRAELAADAANPASPTHAQSAQALLLDKPPVEKPPRPLDQQLLEAIASGDKTKQKQITDTLAADANAKRDPVATAQLEAIRNLTQQEAQNRIENDNPQSGKNQQKFEQEYRTVLQRGLSSRSGGLGMEDLKVQQANHLTSLMDQFYDPKTGVWNIPRVQLNELALGLAKLTAPGGQAGEGMLREFQQRTAKGDIAGALTYITGSPVGANTQEITKMLHDSIDRQGKTAEQNREGEMAYLRGLAPTDLSEDRRQKLEATSLNPLRQSRVATGPNGQKKLFTSVDGGKTWQ